MTDAFNDSLETLSNILSITHNPVLPNGKTGRKEKQKKGQTTWKQSKIYSHYELRERVLDHQTAHWTQVGRMERVCENSQNVTLCKGNRRALTNYEYRIDVQ